MLTPEEALLFKAVQDEQEYQNNLQAGVLTGGVGGALLGAAGGTIPHKVGNALNALTGRPQKGIARTLKPGFRMAGGLTGLILGGGLGAGMAALMKQDQAGKTLGKIQAQGGELDEMDKAVISKLLGEIYSNPSQLR